MKPAEMTDYWKNKNLYTSYFQFNVCRLCAEECDSLTPIFGNYNESGRLDLKIKKCLPVIMVLEDDIKPKQICMSCVSKLDQCSSMIESCIAADYKFEELIQKAYNPAPSYQVHTQDSSYLTQLVWTADTDLKNSEKSNVLIIENLNSSSKTSEQEFVVMVELKYKEPMAMDNGICNSGDKALVPINDSDTIVTFVNDVKDLGAVELTVDHSKINGCSATTNATLEPLTNLESKIDSISANEYQLDYHCLEKSDFAQTCSDLLSGPYTVEKSNISSASSDTLLSRPAESVTAQGEGSEERCIKTPELDGKRYKCTTCGKSFARRSRCKAHIISHSKVRPFNCGSCGKNFITKWECKLHQRIHIGVHTCEFCGKAFSVRNKLERHRRVHTGEKPFACNYCDKSFADKRNLDNHLRTHTGERPYSCQTCNDSFRTLTHLKDHQTVHSKEASFCCYFCDKRFKWKTNLQIHLKKHAAKDRSSQQIISPKVSVMDGNVALNSALTSG